MADYKGAEFDEGDGDHGGFLRSDDNADAQVALLTDEGGEGSGETGGSGVCEIFMGFIENYRGV